MELIGGSILVVIVMLTIKLETQVTIGLNEQKPCEVAKSMANGSVHHYHHYHDHHKREVAGKRMRDSSPEVEWGLLLLLVALPN